MNDFREIFLRYRFYILVFIIIFVFPYRVGAHSNAEQSFLKVNGAFTEYYPIPSSSIPDFGLPEDVVSETALFGEEIRLELVENALPVPKEVIEKTKFLWEFGDGNTGLGLSVAHRFSKPGTYFINLKADLGQGFEAQPLLSAAINVVKDKNFQLPKAIIKVNGRRSNDPLLDIIDVNFNKDIFFDGSKSTGGSSEIVEYFWDLGDQKSRKESVFSYKYEKNPDTVFLVLRVKTRDGFIADAFIQIKDEQAFDASTGITAGFPVWKVILGAVVLSFVLAGILTFIIFRLFFSKSNNN